MLSRPTLLPALLLLSFLHSCLAFHSSIRSRRNLPSHPKLLRPTSLPTFSPPHLPLLASTDSSEADRFDLGAWFNPNTRGGVIVWSGILLVIPFGINNYLVSTGLEEEKVGAYVGFSFVVLSMVGWASTYLFRVANKDMTYAKQLKDYENAVLQKRLEELADDEIQALMEEIDREDQGLGEKGPAASPADAKEM